MKKRKGFTLVELVIVIVIVGILSIVAVPLYRGYTRKAMATEGKSLLGTIQTSEKVYFTEYAAFKSTAAETTFDSDLDIDARPNKYFTFFKIAASGTGTQAVYTGTTTGAGGASGITLTIQGSSTGQPNFVDAGLN